MNPPIQFKTTILPLLIALALGCFALSPQAGAFCREGCLIGESTVLGDDALSGLTGFGNTAIGFHAMHNSTTGGGNTATGSGALLNNTTGSLNTANGAYALVFNSIGGYNTATGSSALLSNTTGNLNTANGAYALYSNTTGGVNVAIGLDALYTNTIGSNNTAVGVNALVINTGSNNVGLGVNAGHNLTAGSGNVCIGAGVLGVAGESSTTRIKNVYTSVATARAVYVNSDNKIGTLASSRRFKEEIRPMEKVSETILGLKPVTFRYKKDIDPSHALSFGLIAEEVAQVNPDLITCDQNGKPETVRYDAVNAMLLNEFLKEHSTVQALTSTVAKQEAIIAKQQKDFQATAAHQQSKLKRLLRGCRR